MTYQTLIYIQVDHVSEKEIDLQKWKEKILTSATEDENAIADRQMIEKRDQESGDRQSAQTGHDRVDVRKRSYKYYSTNFDCQFKTELEKNWFIKIQNVNDVLFFSRVTCGSKEQEV